MLECGVKLGDNIEQIKYTINGVMCPLLYINSSIGTVVSRGLYVIEHKCC